MYNRPRNSTLKWRYFLQQGYSSLRQWHISCFPIVQGLSYREKEIKLTFHFDRKWISWSLTFLSFSILVRHIKLIVISNSKSVTFYLDFDFLKLTALQFFPMTFECTSQIHPNRHLNCKHRPNYDFSPATILAILRAGVRFKLFWGLLI